MSQLHETVGLTLDAFRARRIEPEWERLDRPDGAVYASLWDGLRELGLVTLGLPEARTGVDLDPDTRFAIAARLGAAAPALAFGLIAHATAFALLDEATGGSWPAPLDGLLEGPRLALGCSPLDARPETSFHLSANGKFVLSGAQRVALAHAEWLVIPASDGAKLRLCVLRLDAPGASFTERPSSHGLKLVRFGELALDHVEVPASHVLPWPDSGIAANEADGLVAALLAGLTRELAGRATVYALERWQGGKRICEHDAVQQLVGPIELGARALRVLAIETLSGRRRGDGAASALAVQTARAAGLDAIQTFGGNGYMEDFRVERYLRDANTLETFWVHAASRQRAIARARFADVAATGVA